MFFFSHRLAGMHAQLRVSASEVGNLTTTVGKESPRNIETPIKK